MPSARWLNRQPSKINIQHIIKYHTFIQDLFTCTVQNRCVALNALQTSFSVILCGFFVNKILKNSFVENATIGKDLYNELDKYVDYGCIFTSGCMDECNKCPLCMTSKQQVDNISLYGDFFRALI